MSAVVLVLAGCGTVQPVAAEVMFVDTARSQRLAHVMLDGNHGGPIPTQLAPGLEGVPVEALYRVRLRLADMPSGAREERGHVRIDGERHSLLWDSVQWLASVMLRESGF